MSMLSEINLHDARFYAIQHDLNAKELQCQFLDESGGSVTLLMKGVSRFRCVDFGVQNIVLDLCIFGSADLPPLGDMPEYVKWIFLSSDGEQLAQPREIEGVIQGIIEGKVKCISLIPSWGARLGVIAVDVEWRF